MKDDLPSCPVNSGKAGDGACALRADHAARGNLPDMPKKSQGNCCWAAALERATAESFLSLGPVRFQKNGRAIKDHF